MDRREYSAGAVKHSFWFMEFRKVVSLRVDGQSWDDIKQLNEMKNIFGASTIRRANQIYSTVSARVKSLDDSFYQVFDTCDVAGQKLFALVATMANDTLFADFVYEVVREKMIIGTNELADSDIRIFFKNKQEQDKKAAKWTEATLNRLGLSYKNFLLESGITDHNKGTRMILKPILDPLMERWLMDHDMEYCVKALTGVR